MNNSTNMSETMRLENENRYVIFLLNMNHFGKCIKKQKVISGQQKN